MANKYIYVRKKADRCDAGDFEFFATAELLWESYAKTTDGYRELSQFEFLEAVDGEELIEEFNSEFYRDVVVTE